MPPHFLLTLQLTSFWLLSAPLYWNSPVSLKTFMMLKSMAIFQSSSYLTSQQQPSVSHFLFLKTMPYFDSCDITLTWISSWLSGYFSVCFVGSSSSHKSFSRFCPSHLAYWFHILPWPQLPSVHWWFPNLSPYFRLLFPFPDLFLSTGHVGLNIPWVFQTEHVKIWTHGVCTP